jgi:membrane-bound metal-dependent hydrolase YbcI (DUF457 family)
MENGADYLTVGVLIGLTMTSFDQRQGINPVLAISDSTAFAKRPDWLEPATNPHHRQFFHSISFLAVITLGIKKVFDRKPEDNLGQVLRLMTLCADDGYLRHLVLDLLTPRSLQLVGKL